MAPRKRPPRRENKYKFTFTKKAKRERTETRIKNEFPWLAGGWSPRISKPLPSLTEIPTNNKTHVFKPLHSTGKNDYFIIIIIYVSIRRQYLPRPFYAHGERSTADGAGEGRAGRTPQESLPRGWPPALARTRSVTGGQTRGGRPREAGDGRLSCRGGLGWPSGER